MSNETKPDTTPVNDALRRLHRSAIASLGLCAVGIGIATFAQQAPPEEQVAELYSWLALALAAVAILTRRSGADSGRSLRAIVYRSLVSLMAAVALGILGLVVTLREAQTTVGLLYTLAGALLVLRPPAQLAVRVGP